MNTVERKARSVTPVLHPSAYVQLRIYDGEKLFSVAFGEEGFEHDFRVSGFCKLEEANEFFQRWMERRVGRHYDSVAA